MINFETKIKVVDQIKIAKYMCRHRFTIIREMNLLM